MHLSDASSLLPRNTADSDDFRGAQAAYEIDAQGALRNLSDELARWIGREGESLLGTAHTELFELEDPAAWAGQVAERLQAGGVCSDVVRLGGRAGHDALLQLIPRADPDGRLACATALLTLRARPTFDVGTQRAVERSFAAIEFELDGTIVEANQNFLATMGYTRDEIVGQHHRMFVLPTEVASPEYADFWKRLANGEAQNGRFKRERKDGSTLWLQAAYTPVLDSEGRPVRVVKIASDVTAQVEAELRARGLEDAVGRSFARIEFEMDGTIIDANENFFKVMGYSSQALVGKHHRTFVDPTYAASPEYQQVWSDLAAGQSVAGRFQRFAEGGREVWLQASYTPIFDELGQPQRVVKVASDVTESVLGERRLSEGVKRVLDTVDLVAQGDFTCSVGLEGSDDVARIGAALDTVIMATHDDLSAVKETSQSLLEAASRLSGLGEELSEDAQSSSARSEHLNTQSTSVSERVQSVASGAEELRASIDEISRSSSETIEVARNAVERAGAATETIETLGKSSDEIGAVIKVISAIASQTNLLALNATIEAARAGEAGAGFAVVAGEVKNLARQTGDATEQIARQIEAIQSNTGQAVAAISEISAVVEKIYGAANSIAGAVEEQAATTNEIAQSMGGAADASQEVSQGASDLAEGAEAATSRVALTRETAQSLSSIAEQLRDRTSRFTL
ncbi:MAG: PAS domain S-box protein [Planctomycetota bacterium]